MPGDKSISHRAVFIASLAEGKTLAKNFLFSDDSLATVDAFRKLGVKIVTDVKRRQAAIYAKGLRGLIKPKGPIYVRESGTTMRLLCGVLAGQKFSSLLAGAKTLTSRPMRRILIPLRLMGAEIKSKIKDQKSKTPEEYPPLRIKGQNLKAIAYRMPVASAQVKSAIMFAALYADGKTKIVEQIRSRDHSERMLRLFGASIATQGLKISIKKSNLISPGIVNIPSDISSAAFFMVLAALHDDSDVLLKSIGINPTRRGLIDVLMRMGADIYVKPAVLPKAGVKAAAEPIADIRVKAKSLKGVTIKEKDIPGMIDELPVLMVAASLAGGRTIINGVSELRVKETDRINSMVSNLKKMGAKINFRSKTGAKTKEYIEITGVDELKGARVKSFGDHRTAMSMVVAGLLAKGQTHIDDVGCIDKSFPEFMPIVKNAFGRCVISSRD